MAIDLELNRKMLTEPPTPPGPMSRTDQPFHKKHVHARSVSWMTEGGPVEIPVALLRVVRATTLNRFFERNGVRYGSWTHFEEFFHDVISLSLDSLGKVRPAALRIFFLCGPCKPEESAWATLNNSRMVQPSTPPPPMEKVYPRWSSGIQSPPPMEKVYEACKQEISASLNGTYVPSRALTVVPLKELHLHPKDAELLDGAKQRTDDNLRRIFG